MATGEEMAKLRQGRNIKISLWEKWILSQMLLAWDGHTKYILSSDQCCCFDYFDKKMVDPDNVWPKVFIIAS